MTDIDERLPERFLRKVSEMLRVFSHPLRLRIVEILNKRNELKVGDIASDCGESQPLVSQHLTQMRRVGILDTRREGTQVYYRLANGTSRKIMDFVQESYRGSPDEMDRDNHSNHIS